MIQLAVGGGGVVLALVVANIFIALGIFGIGLFIGLLLYVVGYIALMAAGILGLVEGIIYLIKSDEEFQDYLRYRPGTVALVGGERGN